MNKITMNKMKPFFIATLTASFCLTASASFNVQASNKDIAHNWQATKDYYHQQLKSLKTIGSATARIENGQISQADYYGLADKDKGTPVDEHTIFHWASITKTFTGISIMQLVERGKISLSDPITNYLPELKAVHNPFGDMSDITIKHVMSHSSGFRASSFPWKRKAWHPHEPTQWSQLVAMMPYTEVAFEPGSKFSYSNLAIIFLGQIIEQVSGDDIEVYIDKNIFKPLKMYSAYFDHTPYHLLPHRSNYYYYDEGKLVTGDVDFDTGITTANGGLNASVKDMSHYAAFLIGDNNKAIYNTVLKRSSLEQMWQVQHPTKRKTRPNEDIGLAFFIRKPHSKKFIGHSGSQKDFTSFFYVSPSNKKAIIGVFNSQTWIKDENDKYKNLTSDLFGELQKRHFAWMDR